MAQGVPRWEGGRGGGGVRTAQQGFGWVGGWVGATGNQRESVDDNVG